MDGLFYYISRPNWTQTYVVIIGYNTMDNMTKSDSPSECLECDEMTQLVGIDWFPSLFTKLILLSILAVFTTVANVFLMYIACRTKSLVSNTKIFFVSLCLAHLIGSTIVIPFWIITRLYPGLAQTSYVFCQSASFFWILMILASFYSLSTLSLDRFFIISNPLRYPFKATSRRKMIVVAGIWFFCILFASAPILGWGEYKFEADAVPICGLNMKHSLSFTIFLIVVGFGLPMVVDIFCCGRIISIARRQSRCIASRKGSEGSVSSATSSCSTSSLNSGSMIQPVSKLSKLKQKLNSLRLVFAGTGSFFVCWLPYLGAHVWMTTVRNISHAQESMPYILEFVVMFIALLNGLINPIVLLLSNRDYRKEIRKIFTHRFQVHSEDRSDTDSMTHYSRRSQNLTRSFQSMQEIPSTPEVFRLKKQDSEISINSESCCSDTHFNTDILDLCQLQVSVVANIQECKELMSQSCRHSVDFGPQLEHIKVEGHETHSDVVQSNEFDECNYQIRIDNPD